MNYQSRFLRSTLTRASLAVMAAFMLLASHPIVLGPSADGGYYLVGLQKITAENLYPLIFSGIAWSQSDVFEATCRRVRQAGFQPGLLEKLQDIDEAKDLTVARQHGML